jgi:hypothetical protein
MADGALTDNDARVLDRLHTELAAFDLGMTSQESLVRTVAELLDQFEAVPLAFVEECRSIWWEAQYTHALTVDQQRDLTADESEVIRGAVIALENLLHGA